MDQICVVCIRFKSGDVVTKWERAGVEGSEMRGGESGIGRVRVGQGVWEEGRRLTSWKSVCLLAVRDCLDDGRVIPHLLPPRDSRQILIHECSEELIDVLDPPMRQESGVELEQMDRRRRREMVGASEEIPALVTRIVASMSRRGQRVNYKTVGRESDEFEEGEGWGQGRGKAEGGWSRARS